MNTRIPLWMVLAGLAAACPALRAQEAEEAVRVSLTKAALAALRPGNRAAVVVAPEERNPFAQKVQPVRPAQFEMLDTEESRLRAILANLPVGGVSAGGQSPAVLMGSLRLAVGQELPKLLPNQAERIRVVSVDENVVVFGFLETNGEVGDRTLVRSISLAPEVRYKLPSQSPARGGPPPSGVFGGVMRGHESR
ncbi:MAG: hypothetical protein N2322_07895 [Terrimicrobiaceae bacterium]|nr:hypothetical protein [Terrimicrobiaceae bacterium]